MSASKKYYEQIATLLGENRRHFKDAKQWAYLVEDFIKMLRANERFKPDVFRRYAIEVANTKEKLPVVTHKRKRRLFTEIEAQNEE